MGWIEWSGVGWDVGISTRHQRGSGVNTRLGFLSARYSFDLSTSLSDPGQRAEALPWPWQEGYTELIILLGLVPARPSRMGCSNRGNAAAGGAGMQMDAWPRKRQLLPPSPAGWAGA